MKGVVEGGKEEVETIQDERKFHFWYMNAYMHSAHTHTRTPNSTLEIHIYKYIGYMALNRFKSNKHNAMECSSLTASLWLNWHTQLVSVEQVKVIVIVFPFVHDSFSTLVFLSFAISLHYIFMMVDDSLIFLLFISDMGHDAFREKS